MTSVSVGQSIKAHGTSGLEGVEGSVDAEAWEGGGGGVADGGCGGRAAGAALPPLLPAEVEADEEEEAAAVAAPPRCSVMAIWRGRGTGRGDGRSHGDGVHVEAGRGGWDGNG